MDYATFAELLDYPTRGVPHVPDAAQVPPEVRGLLEEFSAATRELGPGRLEEVYAATFDLHPERTLNMGCHMFTDEWKRSALLIELKALFKRRALDHGSELPDHLCWLLRLMATAPEDDELREFRQRLLLPALQALSGRMPEGHNPYPPLLRALYLVASKEEART